ncbi:DUF4334 domain-containing protein [Cereibacter changlensis]|uniref:DUF4334 domain-containing protein n=1 Tax=Cereibacter changlensis TaxID=402884 RepID=A0A4U0YWU6_9RHOB|nr:DUF4334 domain-containing protein [Cereibacter changlensis]TKA97270.1 DUF4334 domain-containing protein [Cereibacter changlensis]
MTDPAPDALARLSAGLLTTDAALEIFDRLPPASLAGMIGGWEGRGVATGHPLDGLLEAYGWRGKRFDSAEAAHPLLFGKDGAAFAISPALLPLGLALRFAPLLRHRAVAAIGWPALRLLRTRRPQARLRMVEYRGVTTATMIYDALPILDAFRRIDDDNLLGAMDLRQSKRPFFFLLRRR